MSLLDRYIARQFLTNVVVLFVILFCFIITIDVSLNIDRFSRIATELMASQGQSGFLKRASLTSMLILDLWWPRLLQLFNYMLGLVMVAAMGFTCSQMVRHRELVAILASGQSLMRVARPVLLA
ncbi:MAG: hypothetical protein KDA28_07830, partial [Phycisphaerales bacterium]|nr:hypothetical protein [Phycisphaerales bacterium]